MAHKAIKVHYFINAMLTAHAVVVLALHEVGPYAEAIGFCFAAVAATWAADIERKFRHPKLA